MDEDMSGWIASDDDDDDDDDEDDDEEYGGDAKFHYCRHTIVGIP